MTDTDLDLAPNENLVREDALAIQDARQILMDSAADALALLPYAPHPKFGNGPECERDALIGRAADAALYVLLSDGFVRLPEKIESYVRLPKRPCADESNEN